MLFDGSAVHLRETRVDAPESQVCVDEAKADWSRGVNRLDVCQMAACLFLAPATGLFSLPLTGDVTTEGQPTTLTMKFQRFGRKSHQEDFARLLLHFKLKITDAILVFQDPDRPFSVYRISIKSEKKRAFSDQVLARIAGHRDETVVNFKNHAVGYSADDQRIRACLECLCESLLALAQLFLRPLPLGYIEKRGGHQNHTALRIIDRRAINRKKSLCSITAPIPH